MIIKDIINKENNDLIIALSYILDKPKSYIYLNQDYKLDDKTLDEILRIEDELSEGIPLQYAIGFWEFYGLMLKVDQRALIPRFETEIIIDYLINSDLKKKSILDIGTGTGAISLSLAKNLPKSDILGVDIVDEALSLARENKQRLNIKNVRFIKSDLFSNVDKSFDIIISNPPYVSENDYKSLDDKLYHEPKSALVGGFDGLYFYRKIINQANDYINNNGHLIFEIGYDQKDDINKLLVKSDFKNIINLKDYNGYDRFIIAQKG